VAYSKTPEGDTHSVKRIPGVGSPFVVPNFSDFIPQTLNYYNCFPIKEKQFGQEAKFSVEKREPYKIHVSGTTAATTTASFSRWVIHPYPTALAFVARGGSYWYFDPDVGTFTAVGAYVNAVMTGVCTVYSSAGESRIVAISGTTVNSWLADGSGFTTDAIATFIVGQYGLVSLNGYIFGVSDTGAIYNSTAGGVYATWATTDYIVPEIDTDGIINIKKHYNSLVVLGRESIEFFQDGAVEIGSPLVRMEQYYSRIGCAQSSDGYRSSCTIDNDIYFLGKSRDKSMFLARIRDFKVETLGSDSLEKIINSPMTTAATSYHSIITWTVNNHPMVMIRFMSAAGVSTSIMYDPEADSWWTIDTSDIGGTYDSDTGADNFVGIQFYKTTDAGSLDTGRHPYFLTSPTQRTTTTVEVRKADSQWTTSNTATVWTDVIDMDVDRWKHVYKISAVGDYRGNTLTLSYCNNPTYDAFTTMTPTKVQSTLGARNQLTWTNAGQFRQFALKLDMAGAYPAKHTGFEIAYNLKMQ